jgi:hypothetical protein
MPIDAYNVHAYMDTSATDILAQVKTMVNNTRRQMKEVGEQNKWLIITETGALYDAGSVVINRYMNRLFDYLSTATSEAYGCPTDGNKLVQRWAWFALTTWDPHDVHRWQGTDLVNIDTCAITSAGQNYSEYPKGPPVLPCAFWGNVSINGQNIPAGTLITAWISDTQVTQTTALIRNGASVYTLDIPGDNPDTPALDGGNPGEVVRFKVGTWWAEESGTWQTGDASNMNLTRDDLASPLANWVHNYGSSAGSWTNQNQFPRAVADVNGDGKVDVVGFGKWGTLVSLSTGAAFDNPAVWIRNYGATVGSWTSQDRYPRLVADVDGAGKADIVGFGQWGTFVSLSTGSEFAAPALWIRDFGVGAGGWSSQNLYPRMLGDANGDGKADLVGFKGDGVYISLSNGGGFAPSTRWVSGFVGTAWPSQDRTPRTVADVNGDGRADVVGFGTDGVYVALNTGSAFAAPSLWVRNFGANAGGWSSQDRYPRMLADMNGDGKADIVAFSGMGTLVAASTGTGFSWPVLWIRNFGANAGGWTSQNLYPRMVADVNGDQKADIVGFSRYGALVSLTNANLSASGAPQASEPPVPVDNTVSEKAISGELPADAGPAPNPNAWRGEYFANSSLTGEPALVRDDQGIDFDWGEGSPDPRLPADGFSVRWTRTLPFDEGDYAFRASTDDGVRLFVDGQLLIDRWVERQATELMGQIHLVSGEHVIIMEYFEGYQGAVAKLAWERLVPSSVGSGAISVPVPPQPQ